MPTTTGSPSSPDPRWSSKEVLMFFWQDVSRRMDSQDVALDKVQTSLLQTATKEDIKQVHERIDGVEARFNERVEPLEQQAADEKAIEQARSSRWSSWGVKIAAAAGIAMVASVVLALIATVH